LAESDIFCLCGAEGNLGLELRTPLNRAASQRHDLSGAGFDTDWVLIALVIPQASKIGIYVAVKVKIGTWLEGEIIVLHSLKISADVLYGFLVTSAWAVREPYTLILMPSWLRIPHWPSH
jgi:hypothetical protein